MKYRVYIPHIQHQVDHTLEPDQCHHLIKVLRVPDQSTIEILNGKGSVYLSTLHIISKKNALLKNIICHQTHHEPQKKVTLIIGITKLNTLDTILQKATEMGVWSIQPVATEFTPIKKSLFLSEKKQEHWQKILQSSMIQSKNPWLPKLEEPINILDITPEPDTLILHPYASPIAANVLADVNRVAIGPEGGWSKKELAFFNQNKMKTFSFPTPIMRAETCVSASLAILYL
jgi:16S rRNA (uracil1498-N3)-methyltransferase